MLNCNTLNVTCCRLGQGYMPGQLFKLQSAYGDQKALIELTRALSAAGIAPVCDIVINHRCAPALNADHKDCCARAQHTDGTFAGLAV